MEKRNSVSLGTMPPDAASVRTPPRRDKWLRGWCIQTAKCPLPFGACAGLWRGRGNGDVGGDDLKSEYLSDISLISTSHRA